MKIEIKIVLLFSAIFVFTNNSYAQETGLDLYQKCQSFIDDLNGKELTAEQAVGNLWLLGYISDFVDFHSISQSNCSNCQYDFCLPSNGLPNEETIKCVYNFVRKKPESVKLTPRMLILAALMDSYPCKKKQ
jgi:Rap1a immunity proteins